MSAKAASPHVGAKRRALSAPHLAPISLASIWENGLILPGATREYARAEGLRFPDALISNLKAARVGPARASLCAARQAEAREALREAESVLEAAEEAVGNGEGFAALVPGLRETHWLCSGLAHALEILEANSRACGEGPRVMVDYPPLIAQAGNCEWRLTRLAERWRETEGTESTFGRFVSMVASPFAAMFQTLMPNIGLVSDTPGRRRACEDDACSTSSGRPPPSEEGDADAGAGGGAGHRSAASETASMKSEWSSGGRGCGTPRSAKAGTSSPLQDAHAGRPVEEPYSGRSAATSSTAPAEDLAAPRRLRGAGFAPAEPVVAQEPLSPSGEEPALQAELERLKVEMERKAMQAEDTAAQSREMRERWLRELSAAQGQVESQQIERRSDVGSPTQACETRPEAPRSDEEEFFDPGDE